GGGSFPVRRIFCVGRNYAAHAREMGRDPDREPPFFFTKFADSVAPNGATIAYPPETANYHYEAELVMAIGRAGFRIPAAEAKAHIHGYAVGLDMTRRDLQLAARELGRPWDTGKNFPDSAPLAALHPASEIGHPRSGAIWLEVDGERKQEADLADMLWNCDEIVEHLSYLYRLLPGDLIMTGTPAGVGPVVGGQELRVHVDGLEELRVRIG
ncbi:MAG: fumarylacetoacetate hydrolase family protein, partial [Ectothiorhodospiraceae bacterium]|nr:fumarylacetoacetate hydrolase family protein [Ectothiorhodospiraceae bacterium]MCH8503309.1 fumarylacetoacetate hydrolase family protein [Ectothiorhodospiraceae bacterium]